MILRFPVLWITPLRSHVSAAILTRIPHPLMSLTSAVMLIRAKKAAAARATGTRISASAHGITFPSTMVRLYSDYKGLYSDYKA